MSSRPLEPVYIALGGNLGDVRARFFSLVRVGFPKYSITVLVRSSVYRTRALTLTVDEVQPDYWNAVVRVDCGEQEPLELMENLRSLEDEYRRTRERRWAPRTLDLDLLVFGQRVVNQPTLSVPHPRLHERAFVLVPLAEIAPDLPIPGRGTASQALSRLQSEDEILERDGGFASGELPASTPQ
ncbi:MAG: 2-amino-4-hydroxy-6-hydroxymethyldihydropteridine diphosphokinase [Myxococcota bacterium]